MTRNPHADKRYSLLFLLILIQLQGCSSSPDDAKPTDSTGSKKSAQTETSPPFEPGWYAQGGKIFGNGLKFRDPGDQNGLFIGAGQYEILNDRGLFSIDAIRNAICLLGQEGFNYFRTFSALGAKNRRQDFVSPWQNRDEWITRRDALLQAGLDCGVYIQISLFDEKGRNDPERRGAGYSRSDNSWNGREPSFETAANLASSVYLWGLDSNSAIGKILIVEDFNEPNEDDWKPEWARQFQSWLKDGGWETGSVAITVGGDEDDPRDYSVGDKVEVHFSNDNSPEDILSAAKSIRDATGRAPAISSDGAAMADESLDFMKQIISESIRNRYSFELFIAGGLSLTAPDAALSSGGWSGKTTREYLREIIKAAQSASPQTTDKPAPTPDPVGPPPNTNWAVCFPESAEMVSGWAINYADDLIRLTLNRDPNPGLGTEFDGFNLDCFLLRNITIFRLAGYQDSLGRLFAQTGNTLEGASTDEERVDRLYRFTLRREGPWPGDAQYPAWSHYYDPYGWDGLVARFGTDIASNVALIAAEMTTCEEFRQKHTELF